MNDKGWYQKVGTNVSEEGNLWAHQGDDDQPSPDRLKKHPSYQVSKPYYTRHRQFHVHLSAGDMERLERLQKHRGLSKAEWLRHAIAMDEAQRPSEAGQYVRRIIPEQVAIVAEQILNQWGEVVDHQAERYSDWQVRRAHRQDAGQVWDAASWFGEVRREYERLHAQDAAQSPAATTAGIVRRKTARHTTG